MATGRLSTLLNVVLTVPVAPGILAHEYAHVAGCRLAGVSVESLRPLTVLTDEAGVVHERVDSFPADVVVGFAPLVVNSALAAGCFVAAALFTAWVPGQLVLTWAGGAFGITAFPTHYDTESFLRTARAPGGRPGLLALAVAYPLRALTAVPYLAGVYGLLWTVYLYAHLG